MAMLNNQMVVWFQIRELLSVAQKNAGFTL